MTWINNRHSSSLCRSNHILCPPTWRHPLVTGIWFLIHAGNPTPCTWHQSTKSSAKKIEAHFLHAELPNCAIWTLTAQKWHSKKLLYRLSIFFSVGKHCSWRKFILWVSKAINRNEEHVLSIRSYISVFLFLGEYRNEYLEIQYSKWSECSMVVIRLKYHLANESTCFNSSSYRSFLFNVKMVRELVTWLNGTSSSRIWPDINNLKILAFWK